MRIHIFSRPVHSGKTSALLQWCEGHNNIAGILMPDIDGLRKVLDLETRQVIDIECADPVHSNEPITSVGRFNFYTSAFERANSILLQALEKDPEWLVIDEVGKLELDGKGFYQALRKVIPHYSNPDTSGNLLFCVRDSLCFDVISFFNIKHFRVVYSVEELS